MQTETMELQVIEIPEFLPVTKQSGIAKAEQYAATFAPFMIAVKELSEKAAGINHTEPSALDAKLAREVRLSLVKNRTATASKKDESKAALLAESNLIQNLHNVVVNTSQLIEAELTAVEKYAENKEKERIEVLRVNRAEQLSHYVEDANIFPLGTMTEDAFTELLTGSRLAFEKRQEDARLAEERRIKEENDRLEEQKRIREENDMLKKEAEEKEKQMEAERKEQAEKLAAIEAENKKAREKAAAEQKKKDEAADAELRKQKEAADKLAAELKAKQDEEKAAADKLAKEQAEKLAAEKKAAKAPDKDKLKSAVSALPTFTAIDLKTKEAQAVADAIRDKFSAFKKWANEQIETL